MKEENVSCFNFQNFSSYFGDEHSRLLALWRAVVQIRRGFNDLKSTTKRDLEQAANNVQVCHFYLMKHTPQCVGQRTTANQLSSYSKASLRCAKCTLYLAKHLCLPAANILYSAVDFGKCSKVLNFNKSVNNAVLHYILF